MPLGRRHNDEDLFFKILQQEGQGAKGPMIAALLKYQPDTKQCKTCTNVSTEISRVALAQDPPRHELTFWGKAPYWKPASQKIKVAHWHRQGSFCNACMKIFNHEHRARLQSWDRFEEYVSSTSETAEKHQQAVTAVEDCWIKEGTDDPKGLIDWSWVASRQLEIANTQKMKSKHPGWNFVKWIDYITKVNTSGELRDGEIRAPGLCGNDGVWWADTVTKIGFSESIAAHLRTHLNTGTENAGSKEKTHKDKG